MSSRANSGRCSILCSVAVVVLTAVLAGSVPAIAQAASPADKKSVRKQAAAENAQEAQMERRKARDAGNVSYIAANSSREDMVSIPMRDGVRLSATILLPKIAARTAFPTILIFTPYAMERVIGGYSRYIRPLIDNGYAVAIVNQRGRYFSEGTYTYLGGAGADGYDTIDWLSKLPWSNGRIGTLGCSSGAEEQHKMNAMHHPALRAAVPISSGAGIGRVGAYHEMGNFYRGGAIQNYVFTWYPNYGYKYKPAFSAGLSRQDMLRLAPLWNLEPNGNSDVDLNEAIWTLPFIDVLTAVRAAPSDLDQRISWQPNDPRWKLVEFGNEGDRSAAPALYINAFYDLSIGPNMAMFEYQTRNAATELARDNVFTVIAPTLHCQQGNVESERTIVGERDMGDARFDYEGLVLRWYDHWLKDVDNGVVREPKVRADSMGENRWRSYDSWPPASKPLTFYLDSDGAANTRNGNGRLVPQVPAKDAEDRYVYDPLNPTPTVGGAVCCFAAAVGGPFDQSEVQLRPDVLVYDSPQLAAPLAVTGNIEVTLYLSSDVKDTDLLVKLIDVGPDGRAFNLDEGVMRVRWREGYDQAVFMTAGQVYEIRFPPLVTSNVFKAGHRVRIAVSSSSFPQYERNLNTGGANVDERTAAIANNAIHHGPKFRSRLVLPLVQDTGFDPGARQRRPLSK